MAKNLKLLLGENKWLKKYAQNVMVKDTPNMVLGFLDLRYGVTYVIGLVVYMVKYVHET